MAVKNKLLTIGLTGCIVGSCWAWEPTWWHESGVISHSADSSDFSVATHGQMKAMAVAAAAEMDAKLPGGAGPAIHQVVDAWTANPSAGFNYAVLTMGELKAVGKLFYDRLLDPLIGYDTKANLIRSGYPENWQSNYPWDSNAPSANATPATVGQLKMVYCFDVGATTDLDGNKLLDDWERLYFGATGQNPNLDSDGDGVSNYNESLVGSDPTDFYDQGGVIITPTIVVLSGSGQSVSNAQVTPNPISFKVTNSAGNPIANAPVVINVEGTGTVSPSSNSSQWTYEIEVRTNSQGIASAYYKAD